MSRPTAEARPDLYARVTDAILADLERGVRPWARPWSAEQGLAGAISRPLRHNFQPYSGINVLLLWAEACAKGYSAPIWMTFRQALELGGCVRNGEHAPALDPPQRIDRAEAFFSGLKADIRHGGSQAYYMIGEDRVQMPPFESFIDPQSYYATLAHECTHWTRHPSRLDRDLGRKRWGDEGYAREELVAELGAAFLCADLGLALTPREDHAAYLRSWLEVLQGDKRYIFSASAHAQKAADYLVGLQPEPPG